MKGTIKQYNINSQSGIIIGYDAKNYTFNKEDFLQEKKIKEGMDVDFEIQENSAKNIYILNNGAINKDGNIGCLLGGVCFFVPVVGIILYFLWVNKMPKKAKQASRLAFFGIIADVIMFFLWIFLHLIYLS